MFHPLLELELESVVPALAPAQIVDGHAGVLRVLQDQVPPLGGGLCAARSGRRKQPVEWVGYNGTEIRRSQGQLIDGQVAERGTHLKLAGLAAGIAGFDQ